MDTFTPVLAETAHTALYAAANGRGQTAHVPRRDLFALLADHAEALAKLEECGIQVKEG